MSGIAVMLSNKTTLCEQNPWIFVTPQETFIEDQQKMVTATFFTTEWTEWTECSRVESNGGLSPDPLL
ncbi:MAG: hypothetical protein WCP35_09885, partial [Verrucomicrobiota bacterium]